MIRYPVGRQALLDKINTARPNWLTDAQARTALYATAHEYTGGTEFWGDIKQVYIDIQHEKCAYCETWLQGAALASKVHEVEHFRPKSSLQAWPNRKRKYWKEFPTGIPTGGDNAKGYFLLAYHPFNYSIACTRCNSTLKSNYFPVRGTRDVTLADPSQAAHEDALLVYPISDIDSDPSQLIAFDGVLAVPRQAAGPDHERALTTISFFQLNHQDLTTRRAALIGGLWIALEQQRTATAAADRQFARSIVDRMCGERGEFSACMQAFRQLYLTDRALARDKARAAQPV